MRLECASACVSSAPKDASEAADGIPHKKSEVYEPGEYLPGALLRVRSRERMEP